MRYADAGLTVDCGQLVFDTRPLPTWLQEGLLHVSGYHLAFLDVENMARLHAFAPKYFHALLPFFLDVSNWQLVTDERNRHNDTQCRRCGRQGVEQWPCPPSTDTKISSQLAKDDRDGKEYEECTDDSIAMA